MLHPAVIHKHPSAYLNLKMAGIASVSSQNSIIQLMAERK